MNTKLFGTFAAAAFIMAAIPAFGQDTSTAGVQFNQDGRPERIFIPVSGLNNSDMNFLKQAAIANMFEIESSKIAQDKGSSAFTKEFSKEMLADHTASLEEMRLIANAKGFTLPQDLPGPQKRMIEKLQSLSGDAFDAAYAKFQKGGHEDASMAFKHEIANGQDQDVKAYAVKTLPVVTMHYKMVLTGKTMMGDTRVKDGS